MILYNNGEEKANTIVGKATEHRPHNPSPCIPALRAGIQDVRPVLGAYPTLRVSLAEASMQVEAGKESSAFRQGSVKV